MYPFYNNANLGFPLFPFPFPVRRTRVRTIDDRGIYEVFTTGVAEDATAGNTSVTYGINPCTWRALPNECVILWKVRHTPSTAAAGYPVSIAVPSGGSSTVTSGSSSSDQVTGSKKISVVDNKSTQVVSSDVTNTNTFTEHLVYINKCTGTFKLLGVTAAAAPAA